MITQDNQLHQFFSRVRHLIVTGPLRNYLDPKMLVHLQRDFDTHGDMSFLMVRFFLDHENNDTCIAIDATVDIVTTRNPTGFRSRLVNGDLYDTFTPRFRVALQGYGSIPVDQAILVCDFYKTVSQAMLDIQNNCPTELSDLVATAAKLAEEKVTEEAKRHIKGLRLDGSNIFGVKDQDVSSFSNAQFTLNGKTYTVVRPEAGHPVFWVTRVA